MISKFSNRQWYGITFIISLVLSLLALLPQNPINPDGILYIQTAQIYLQHGLPAAMHNYPWPFFSVLIALTSQYLPLSLLSSAHLINAFLQALLCLAFVWLISTINNSQRLQKFAVLVILVYPYLNSIRSYVTRDFGYWAFTLLAIITLLKLARTERWRYALLWPLSMAMATIFRVEGAVILAFAPLAMLWPSTQFDFAKRLKLFLQSQSLLLLGGLLVIIYWLLFHHHQPNTEYSKLGRLIELKQEATQGFQLILNRFNDSALQLRKAILNNDSYGTERIMLFGGLLFVYLWQIISTITPLFLILCLYGQYKKYISSQYQVAPLLYGLLTINIVILAMFMAQKFFLSGRYTTLLALVMLCWLPFTLENLYGRWQANTLSAPVAFTLIALLSIMTIGGLVRFGYSKSYLVEAGSWLAQNTSAHARVFTNSKEVAFYRINEDTKRLLNTFVSSEIHPASLCHYDWVALRENTKELPIHVATKTLPKKCFSNKRHDNVCIYSAKDFC